MAGACFVVVPSPCGLVAAERVVGGGHRAIDGKRHRVGTGCGQRFVLHSYSAISAHEQMAGFSVASKLNADWEFLIQLRDIGRATAEAWLAANHARLGVDSTIDIKAEYL